MATDSAVTPLLPPPAAASTGGSAVGVYIAVALTALSPVSFGYVLGFSSPAAAPLLASGLLTSRQLDIFEALSPLGGIAGAAVAGIGADYFGRTRALALSCAPFALGWALISAAEVRSAGATPRLARTLTKRRGPVARRALGRSSSAACSPARAWGVGSTSCRFMSPKSRRPRAFWPSLQTLLPLPSAPAPC